MSRRSFFRLYLGLFSIGGLFWWVLSHWFYPDWYHNLLGFGPLTANQYAMAKVIGTLSSLPVLGMAFVALNPERNRDFFIGLLAISMSMIATYIYLMVARAFPRGEWVNVTLIAVNMAVLSWLYPWRESREQIARSGLGS